MSRRVVLLGSTGSVGVQAVDVVLRNPDRFTVTALAAAGTNVAVLAEQAARLGVEQVAVALPQAEQPLRAALAAAGAAAEVLVGPQAVEQVAGRGDDVVLNAMTGSIG